MSPLISRAEPSDWSAAYAGPVEVRWRRIFIARGANEKRQPGPPCRGVSRRWRSWRRRAVFHRRLYINTVLLEKRQRRSHGRTFVAIEEGLVLRDMKSIRGR